VEKLGQRSSGDISKVLESRLLTSLGQKTLQVNENDWGGGNNGGCFISKYRFDLSQGIFPDNLLKI
jgi:hypothetical protein